MTETTWLSAIIGGVVAIVVSLVTALLSKKTADHEDDQKSYDQLQEDNKDLRMDVAALRTELSVVRTKLDQVNDDRLKDRAAALRENTGLWRLVHILESEVANLRGGISTGVIPPLPPRPELPEPHLYGGTA